MITHILEKQYIDFAGSPTTEWEPCSHSPLREGRINDLHRGLIETNPHRDGLGRSLSNGKASFRYNFRHVAYQRIEPESTAEQLAAQIAALLTGPDYAKNRKALELAGTILREREFGEVSDG